MEKILFIRSSSHPDEPYQLRFSPTDDGGVKLRCYCPAGAEQMLCKHVIGLLDGDRDVIFDAGQSELFAEARALADAMGAVDYCEAMDQKIVELKHEFQAAQRALKNSLCSALREGRSFR